jgi:hypothetical protein
MKALVVKTPYLGRSKGDIVDKGEEVDNYKGSRFYNHHVILDIPTELEDKSIKTEDLTPAAAYWSKDGEANRTDTPVIDDYWSKEGEADTTTPPIIDEYWSKEGEADVYSQPIIPEYWSKEGEADVYVEPDPIDDWVHHPIVVDNSWTYHSPEMDESWVHVPSALDTSWDYHPEIKAGDMRIILDVTQDKEDRKKVAKEDRDTDVYANMTTAFGTDNPDSASANYETFKIMAAKPNLFSGIGMFVTVETTSFTLNDALDTDQKVQDYANEMILKAEQYAVDRTTRIFVYLNEKISIENS